MPPRHLDTNHSGLTLTPNKRHVCCPPLPFCYSLWVGNKSLEEEGLLCREFQVDPNPTKK